MLTIVQGFLHSRWCAIPSSHAANHPLVLFLFLHVSQQYLPDERFRHFLLRLAFQCPAFAGDNEIHACSVFCTSVHVGIGLCPQNRHMVTTQEATHYSLTQKSRQRDLKQDLKESHKERVGLAAL